MRDKVCPTETLHAQVHKKANTRTGRQPSGQDTGRTPSPSGETATEMERSRAEPRELVRMSMRNHTIHVLLATDCPSHKTDFALFSDLEREEHDNVARLCRSLYRALIM
jgi:hypothetical protein